MVSASDSLSSLRVELGLRAEEDVPGPSSDDSTSNDVTVLEPLGSASDSLEAYSDSKRTAYDARFIADTQSPAALSPNAINVDSRRRQGHRCIVEGHDIQVRRQLKAELHLPGREDSESDSERDSFHSAPTPKPTPKVRQHISCLMPVDCTFFWIIEPSCTLCFALRRAVLELEVSEHVMCARDAL